MWLGAHTVTHTHAHTPNLSWGCASCFTECETQSTAGRKANFRLQRREHLSVSQCRPCLGWMEDADIRHLESVCVCVLQACVSYFCWLTPFYHPPHSFCIGSTCCAIYSVKLFKCKISAADNFDCATMDDVRAKPKGKLKRLSCLLVALWDMNSTADEFVLSHFYTQSCVGILQISISTYAVRLRSS